MTKPLVEVYDRKDCSQCVFGGKENGCVLCREAKDIIGRVNEEIPFNYKEVDISSTEELLRAYKDDIPTIFINGKKAFKFKVDETEFRKKIRREIIKAGIFRLRKQHYS